MIIYEATKGEFVDDVTRDIIADKIYQSFQSRIGLTSPQEIRSWRNSMEYMNKVLNTSEFPDGCGVAIEYKIPRTNNRIDFILTGLDDNDNKSAIIIELKQWNDEVEAITDRDGIIRTQYYGGRYIEHPSYQAWSYSRLILDYNESVQSSAVKLYPCAYLHNYPIQPNDQIKHEVYRDYLLKSPVFAKGDVFKLRNFIGKYIKKPDQKRVLYIIENGKIRPSKSLQDSLNKMLNGNDEFTMIGEQKVIFEQALYSARESFRSGKKNVIIVEGGPGTGKSVLAINLLVKLTSEDMVCQYITKNQAPREVYYNKLKGSFKTTYIKNLFKGSGAFYESEKNEFDALIVDEAHRLGEKSGMFKNKGENQMKEIIFSSKFSIFFIDENQRIHVDDAGRIVEIRKFAQLYQANILEMRLDLQFRCNGSDAYILWLDNLLELNNVADSEFFEFDYDFQLFDDPNEMRQQIIEKNKISNKSRIVAGYCWDWDSSSRSNKQVEDIYIDEYDFGMSWNLDNTTTWAIDENSVYQAGCIHTSQGIEFDYVGVIIGKDLRHDGKNLITDFSERASTDQSIKGLKGLYKTDPEKAESIADEIIKNTYRTLMTRGLKGCYVFCCDKNLQEYIRSKLKYVRAVDDFYNTEILKKAAETEVGYTVD